MAPWKGRLIIPEGTIPRWVSKYIRNDMKQDLLRYPIGKFTLPMRISEDDRNVFISEIEALPKILNDAVDGLTEEQLDTRYRPDGWTIRQVIHHLADSHLNSYVRFKWTVTESQPVIKAYDEKDWAQLEDARKAPVSLSLHLLEGIHRRWVWFLRSLGPDDWRKCFVHPETNKQVPLEINLALYAWHGKHHLAHILELKKHKDW